MRKLIWILLVVASFFAGMLIMKTQNKEVATENDSSALSKGEKL